MRRRRALLGAVAPVVVALAACGGGDVRPPLPSPELVPELVGAEEVLDRSGRDDFWSERYGDYFEPHRLTGYREAPAEGRFEEFGMRLLEFRLREDLLERHRWRLTREQIDEYRSQPDYESSRAYLARVLGFDPEERP